MNAMFIGGPDRQKQIYTDGMRGSMPLLPTSYTALEQAAAETLSPEAFAYIAGGAGWGTTIQNNRQGFGQWQIVPRMLCDVSQRQMGITLFGKKLPTPFLLSPIGVLEMAHPQADLAVARAAAKWNVPYIFSNQASVPMEECAGAMQQSPRWFQLYWSKSNDLVASFVQRAEKCGCDAIVVTLDTTLLGWRTRDLDLAFLPFLRGQGIAQYTSDPVFWQLLEQNPPSSLDKPKPTLALISNLIRLVRRHRSLRQESFWEKLRSGKPLAAVQQFVNTYSRPSLTWADLPFLRQHTRLPILLKGILHPDDARRALDSGVDGIIISNHGGRQVDGAISTIAALPAIAAALGGQIPILLDSGIRGGADVLKALALGANAVCIGRPYVYGLALAGEAGVSEIIANLIADFDLTMGLAGCTSIEDISADRLVQAR